MSPLALIEPHLAASLSHAGPACYSCCQSDAGCDGADSELCSIKSFASPTPAASSRTSSKLVQAIGKIEERPQRCRATKGASGATREETSRSLDENHGRRMEDDGKGQEEPRSDGTGTASQQQQRKSRLLCAHLPPPQLHRAVSIRSEQSSSQGKR